MSHSYAPRPERDEPKAVGHTRAKERGAPCCRAQTGELLGEREGYGPILGLPPLRAQTQTGGSSRFWTVPMPPKSRGTGISREYHGGYLDRAWLMGP